jgi:Fe-S-cluster containining protein
MPASSAFLSVCKQCTAWCCTMVKPPVTTQERNTILQAGFPDYFVQLNKDIYQIKAEEQHPCPFLKKDYSCEIQNVKPKLCKIWPVIPRYKQSKLEFIIINCPLTSTLHPSEIQHAKKEAETLPPLLIQHLWSISPDMKKKYKRFTYKEI